MAAYKTYSDQELAVLLKDGDQNAYTEIYDRYSPLLYRHAYKKLGNVTESSDVIQDVFLTVWSKRSLIDTAENLSGYLYTAVRNNILNLFAHKKVRSKYEDSLGQFAGGDGTVTDYLVREHQMAEMIEREISALPEKMREIFLLSKRQHMKNKEIAELLGISEHTVATQMKRALKQLRGRLGLVLYISLLLQTEVSCKKSHVPQSHSEQLSWHFDTIGLQPH